MKKWIKNSTAIILTIFMSISQVVPLAAEEIIADDDITNVIENPENSDATSPEGIVDPTMEDAIADTLYEDDSAFVDDLISEEGEESAIPVAEGANSPEKAGAEEPETEGSSPYDETEEDGIGSADTEETETETETEPEWIEVEEQEIFETETEIFLENGGLVAGEINAVNSLSSGYYRTDSNIDRQDYDRWSSPVFSYVYTENGGFVRVECLSNSILVEKYSSDFILKSSFTVGMELSFCGGFYSGKNANYLVFGQNNASENDNVEVIRVVKYSKDWKRLGAASFKGGNTVSPFHAGSLRMAEYNGYLYIRTCHKMYTSEDGLNHQANLTLLVNENTMSLTDASYDVSWIGDAYVSHSFNQFVEIDDSGNLFTLDHGDAYPRGIAVCAIMNGAGTDTLPWHYEYLDPDNYATIIGFPGEIGDNDTGASVGGFEVNDRNLIAAGNSVNHDSAWKSRYTRNIFLSVTPKYNISGGTTAVKWITSYPEGSSINTYTPHLVKLGNDLFILLWDEWDNSSVSEKLRYVFLDGNGNAVGSVYSQPGLLSDCKPCFTGNKVVWYVADGRKVVFYQIGLDGSFSREISHVHFYDPTITFGKSKIDCPINKRPAANPVSTNSDGYITYRSSDSSVAEVDNNGNVKPKKLGTCTITATVSAGTDYVAKSASYTLSVVPQAPKLIAAYNGAFGVGTKWIKVDGATEYTIWQKFEGVWGPIATLAANDPSLKTDRNTLMYTDTSVQKKYGKGYIYSVSVKIGGLSSEYDKAGVAIYRLNPPMLKKITNPKAGQVTVTWKGVFGRTETNGAYDLQYATEADARAGKWINAKKLPGFAHNVTSATITGLKQGTKYVFRIRCSKTNKDRGTFYSEYSPWLSMTVKK